MRRLEGNFVSLGWLRQEIQMLTPGRLASEYLASHIETAAPLTIEGLREGIRFYEEVRSQAPQLRWEPYLVHMGLTLDPEAWPEEGEATGAADNVTDELMALVRQGDETGFRELAGCVMPAEEIDECWAGARGRLGLSGPAPARAAQEVAEMMQPLTDGPTG